MRMATASKIFSSVKILRRWTTIPRGASKVAEFFCADSETAHSKACRRKKAELPFTVTGGVARGAISTAMDESIWLWPKIAGPLACFGMSAAHQEFACDCEALEKSRSAPAPSCE